MSLDVALALCRVLHDAAGILLWGGFGFLLLVPCSACGVAVFGTLDPG